MNDKNKEILISCGINLNEAFYRFVYNEQLYEEMLIHFFETNTELTDLKKSIDSDDYSLAYHYAHSLKGITGNLSLTPVYELCCSLTEMMKNQNYTDISKVYNNLELTYNQIRNIIKSIYPDSKIV
ncbi:MAG: Hpt domain-containing protein [Oscillospiraceae bacterium]|nr:Hpt domain-containing protein [Oscillospiraceae bacterium]